MLINKETAFKNEKLKFPVDYKLKVIMDATINDDENKATLTGIFNRLGIENKNWSSRLSREGSYISFSVMVTLNNQTVFDNLYHELKNVPAIKWAV